MCSSNEKGEDCEHEVLVAKGRGARVWSVFLFEFLSQSLKCPKQIIKLIEVNIYCSEFVNGKQMKDDKLLTTTDHYKKSEDGEDRRLIFRVKANCCHILQM